MTTVDLFANADAMSDCTASSGDWDALEELRPTTTASTASQTDDDVFEWSRVKQLLGLRQAGELHELKHRKLVQESPHAARIDNLMRVRLEVVVRHTGDVPPAPPAASAAADAAAAPSSSAAPAAPSAAALEANGEERGNLAQLSELRPVSQPTVRGRLERWLARRAGGAQGGQPAPRRTRSPGPEHPDIGHLRRNGQVSRLLGESRFRSRLEALVGEGMSRLPQGPLPVLRAAADAPPAVRGRVAPAGPAPAPAPAPIASTNDNRAVLDEIRQILQQQVVAGMLESGFRNRLEHLVHERIEEVGGPAPPIVLESAPPPRERNDWARRLGLINPMNWMRRGQQQQDQQQDDAQADDAWFEDRAPHVVVEGPRGGGGMSRGFAIEIRSEMDDLRREMREMMQLLQTSFEVQLDTQRTFRQEVSAMIHRSAGAHAAPVVPTAPSARPAARGTCMVCCERPVDSVLYRCGHMCTCFQCAHRIKQDTEQCPICRAHIDDVVRVYETSES